MPDDDVLEMNDDTEEEDEELAGLDDDAKADPFAPEDEEETL